MLTVLSAHVVPSDTPTAPACRAGCVLEWDDHLLDELQATSAAGPAESILQAATTSWREVQKGLRQAVDDGIVGRYVFSEQVFRRACSAHTPLSMLAAF